MIAEGDRQMASSLEFLKLRSRVDGLRKHFLPRQTTTHRHSRTQRDRIAAFRLLVCAEIEDFLECSVLRVVDEACTQWSLANRASLTVVTVVSLLYHFGGSADNISLINPGRNNDLNSRIMKAKQKFSHYVKRENHGIGERNLLRLLLPTGFQETDFDVSWLNTVESYVTKRGEAAHLSQATITLPDAGTEWQTVQQIMSGFEEVDRHLQALRGQ